MIEHTVDRHIVWQEREREEDTVTQQQRRKSPDVRHTKHVSNRRVAWHMYKRKTDSVCYTTQQFVSMISGLTEGKRLPADVRTLLTGFSAVRRTVQLTQCLLESSSASAPALGGSGEFLSK